MQSLVFISPLVNTFLSFFEGIFAGTTRPARNSLSLLVLAIIVTGSLSVRRCFNQVMSKLSPKKLKSFYYLLSKGKLSLILWSRHLIRLALSAVPENLSSMSIVLAVDDTMVEKEGTHFAHRKRLFDHSGYRLARAGAAKSDDKGRFIDGHCFVTLLMLVPTLSPNGQVAYRSSVVAQRMWTGEVSKLAMAKELVQLALSELGERQVTLLCDSWYPKGEVAELAEIPNLTIVCNVRHDTAMYDLPQRPEKPQRGRPRVFGERVRITDFELAPVPGTEWWVGIRTVRTRLFKDRLVTAIVTRKGTAGGRRLFLCTKPGACAMFAEHPEAFTADDARKFVAADAELAPLAVYSLRWAIETSYLELKSFWDFREYRVRSKEAVERLLNLQSLVYGVLSLLPALDASFACLDGLSIQERRWRMGQLITRQMFFQSLARRVETDENRLPFLRLCEDLMLQDSLAA